MKKLLLGLTASILSTSAIMAQSFLENNEETVRNALMLYTGYLNYRPFPDSAREDKGASIRIMRSSGRGHHDILNNLNIPLYMNDPKNGTVKFCWYPTKMVFGEEVRTDESPHRTEEGTYVDGRLSMYKSYKGYIYKFYWGNVRDMVLLESIVQYNSNGEQLCYIQRIEDDIYQWETEKTISARAPRHHTRSISMYNTFIADVRQNKYTGELELVGYDFYGGGLRKKYVHGRYLQRDWYVSKDEKAVFEIMPDGRFGYDKFEFNNHTRCEYYVY